MYHKTSICFFYIANYLTKLEHEPKCIAMFQSQHLHLSYNSFRSFVVVMFLHPVWQTSSLCTFYGHIMPCMP